MRFSSAVANTWLSKPGHLDVKEVQLVIMLGYLAWAGKASGRLETSVYTQSMLPPLHCAVIIPTRGWANRWHFERLLVFGPHCAACGVLVLQPAVKPAPPRVEVWNINHWSPGKSLKCPFHMQIECSTKINDIIEIHFSYNFDQFSKSFLKWTTQNSTPEKWNYITKWKLLHDSLP